MKFILEIELGNVGMVTSRQVAEALRTAADKVQTLRVRHTEGRKIFDVNGNSVGKWEYKDE